MSSELERLLKMPELIERLTNAINVLGNKERETDRIMNGAEVAAMLKVKPNTLRKYDREGLVSPVTEKPVDADG